jgi:hypothetical protein
MTPHAITLRRLGTSPNPTGWRFVNVLPESLYLYLASAFVVTGCRTIKVLVGELRFACEEWFAAHMAGGWDILFVRHREPPAFALSGSLWANQGLPLTL